MIFYVLKSALLLTLLYGGFSALLSRETFHRFNRFTLWGIMLISLLLPAIPVSVEKLTPITLEQYWVDDVLNDTPADAESLPLMRDVEMVTSDLEFVPSQLQVEHRQSAEDICLTIYIIGLVVMLLRYAWHLMLMLRGLRGSLHVSDSQGNIVIIKGGTFAPFSFMRYIVISVSDYEQYRHLILPHEQAHARLGHSYDVLMLMIVQTAQWFNPFVWLLGRELKAIHEYEADEAVIRQGIDAKQYQQLLVIKAVGCRLQLFANNLNRGSLKQRIIMMYQKKSNRWRMLRAAFIIPVAGIALISFASPRAIPIAEPQTVVKVANDTVKVKPLVEYKAHDKIGKTFRDLYLLNLREGVWVESDGQSYIEERAFRYAYDDTRRQVTMKLNGKAFDFNSLPKLTNKDLNKVEVRKKGDKTIVNLITTPVSIPSGVQGNVPRVQTLLLPGKGELYIVNGKATPGDWMHSSVTSWERTSYNYSVRNEFDISKTKPGFKCYIYAGVETQQTDIDRAEALMRELGIKNYEIVRNQPVRHFTDAEIRRWAMAEKAKGTAYDKLYDAMAPNHMTVADVRRQWHIVKAVYKGTNK